MTLFLKLDSASKLAKNHPYLPILLHYYLPTTSTGGLAQSGYILYDTDGYGGEVGFNVEYAPFVEYGTVNQIVVPKGWGICHAV